MIHSKIVAIFDLQTLTDIPLVPMSNVSSGLFPIWLIIRRNNNNNWCFFGLFNTTMYLKQTWLNINFRWALVQVVKYCKSWNKVPPGVRKMRDQIWGQITLLLLANPFWRDAFSRVVSVISDFLVSFFFWSANFWSKSPLNCLSDKFLTPKFVVRAPKKRLKFWSKLTSEGGGGWLFQLLQ